MSRLSRIRTACLVTLLGGVLIVPLVRLVRGGEAYTLLPNLEVDSSSYDRYAMEVVKARSLEAVPPTFPPGFVAIVAMIYATVGRSIVAVKVLLWLCLAAAVAGAGVLAYRVHATKTAGWTAAFLTASSPALQNYTGTLQYEVLVSAVILALLFLASVVAKAKSSSRGLWLALGFGLVLGCAVLVRETLIVFVPLFSFFVAYRLASAFRMRVGVAAGALVLVFAAAVSLAWSAAESVRVGHVMLVRDNVQGILPYGHNPYANGTWNDSLAGVGAPSGIRFMVREPGRELWLAGRKSLYFWGVLRDGWNVPRPAAVWIARATGGLVPLNVILPWARGGWLLAAFVVALVAFSHRQWREFWVLPCLVGCLMAVHVATVSSHRFAVPILPVVFAVIAGVLAKGLVKLAGTPVALVALVIAISVGTAMQVQAWPVRYRIDPTELDGVKGENRVEPDGRHVRFADAARGERVAFALYDEYLPGGPVTVQLRVRGGTGGSSPSTPVARLRLFLIDSAERCETYVSPGQLTGPSGWTSFRYLCLLPRDGVARLIVESLGQVDLSFEETTLRWQRN